MFEYHVCLYFFLKNNKIKFLCLRPIIPLSIGSIIPLSMGSIIPLSIGFLILSHQLLFLSLQFSTKGLMITDMGFLDIYPYDTWAAKVSIYILERVSFYYMYIPTYTYISTYLPTFKLLFILMALILILILIMMFVVIIYIDGINPCLILLPIEPPL